MSASSYPLFEKDPTGGLGLEIPRQRQMDLLRRLSAIAGDDHPLLQKVAKMASSSDQKVVAMAYSIADIHVDHYLTNFSISYRIPEELVADDVLPIVQVDKASNKYPIWSRADANKIVDAAVGPRDFPAEIYQSLSSGTYTVKPRAIWSPVPNDLLIAADAPLDLLGTASMDVRGALAKSREIRVSTLVMDSTKYASGLTTALTGNNRWDVGPSTSTADPLNDIFTYMDKCAVRPNLAVCSRPVWTQLRKHPKVVASVKGVALTGAVTGRVAEIDEVSQLIFGGKGRLVVGDAKYRTSIDGVSPETYDFIWGKGFAMIYQQAGAGINTQAWGKTFRHKPISFTTIYDQRPGMDGVTYVKGSHSDYEAVTASDMGALLDTVIS